MPIKSMKLNGEEFQELREKYLNQSADEIKNFLGTNKVVTAQLNQRLMDAQRVAVLGNMAPNFEGIMSFINHVAKILGTFDPPPFSLRGDFTKRFM